MEMPNITPLRHKLQIYSGKMEYLRPQLNEGKMFGG